MRKLAQRRRLLRRQIKQLRQRLSNESLSLFPDFQQARLSSSRHPSFVVGGLPPLY